MLGIRLNAGIALPSLGNFRFLMVEAGPALMAVFMVSAIASRCSTSGPEDTSAMAFSRHCIQQPQAANAMPQRMSESSSSSFSSICRRFHSVTLCCLLAVSTISWIDPSSMCT